MTAPRAKSKAVNRTKNTKAKVFARQVSVAPKRLPLAVAVVFVLCSAGIGLKTLLSSNAATTFGVGANFHCNWQIYSDAQRLQMLDQMAAAGITTVRIDMGWASFQDTSRSSYNNWATGLADYCVDQARARGMTVLASLDTTPGWANGGGGRNVPPADLNDYANIAGWAANHFKGRVAGWEVWNEPNQDYFWKGGINNVGTYVDMLKLAYPKIKAADPNTKVVLGGVSYNDDVWIEQIYKLGGKGSFDVLATHPYQGIANTSPDHPDSDNSKYWLTHFPVILGLMQKYGDGNKEVWFTEFGWSTHDNTNISDNWLLGVTEQQQADYTVQAYKYVMDHYPNVKAMYVYTDRDITDDNIQNNNYGLVHTDLTPKPVMSALKDFTSTLKSPPDTLAPQVNITSPASNSAVSGKVSIAASASDDTGVTKVDFYANNTLVGTDTSAPYEAAWDTSKLANGSYPLVAKAYDAANNIGTSSTVPVNISNTTTPKVTVSSLSATGTFSKNSKVTAHATLDTTASLAVDSLVIAIRDQNNTNYDILLQQSAKLLGTQTFEGTSQILPVGSYRYWVTYKIGSTWTDLSPTKTFGISSGNGLNATYYNNLDFTGKTVSRQDNTIDFLWGKSSPVTGIDPETFSVRWTGKIMVPKNDLYTFYTNADDGMRVWINGAKVIDDWSNHAARIQQSAGIKLATDTKYDITVEFYNNTGSSTTQLFWSSPQISRQIIPQLYLYTQ